ncbi:hypothetical protein EON66_06665 [archaeon]|nr:MAG: hypothetical protein EON66_06665 [archaeon]
MRTFAPGKQVVCVERYGYVWMCEGLGHAKDCTACADACASLGGWPRSDDGTLVNQGLQSTEQRSGGI